MSPQHSRRWAAALLVATAAFIGCTREAEREVYRSAPVIIISIDTLRADHLPAFGYSGVATPNIDSLRADGILFTSAWSHVPLTLPSHVSILTGTLPSSNHVRNNIGYRFEGDLRATLPGVLGTSGYESGAAVSAYVLRGSTGLSGMFDFYDDAIAGRPGVPVGALQRDGERSRRALEAWIDGRDGTPFIALLHLFEPHAPYTPPQPYASTYAESPYDGEIAAADAIVGRFLESLKSKGLYDQALIVLLSDHGEGLGDHGEPEHGVFLYRESIHVPLIVKLPGSDRGGETVDHPVGLVDVAPTVLAALGLEIPASMDGRDLLSHSPPDSEVRRIYGETYFPRIHLGWSELRSLVDDRYHYIEGPNPELYDLTADAAETHNLLEERRREYAAMRTAMDPFRDDVTLPDKIDPEEAKRLVALGYLGSVAPSSSGPLPDPKTRIGVIALMSEAMFLVSQNRHDEAIPKLMAITEREPGMTDAWNQLALSYEALGRYEDAVESYQRAIERAPALASEFGLSLGGVLLKLGKLDEADAHAALAENVNPSGCHVLRARIAFAREDWASAEREANAAMSERYGRLPASVVLARVYAQQGRFDDGLALLETAEHEASETGMGSVETLEYARGDLLARVNRADEAEAAFRREIAAFPRDHLAYSALAILYRMRNDAGSMRAVIEEMVAANPTKRTMLYAAHSLEQLDDHQAAEGWRKRAERSR